MPRGSALAAAIANSGRSRWPPIIYDGTVSFCDRFMDKRSRTVDQMIQAARERPAEHRRGQSGVGRLQPNRAAPGQRRAAPAWTSCCWTTRTTCGNAVCRNGRRTIPRRRRCGGWAKTTVATGPHGHRAWCRNRRALAGHSDAKVVANAVVYLIHQATTYSDRRYALEREFIQERYPIMRRAARLLIRRKHVQSVRQDRSSDLESLQPAKSDCHPANCAAKEACEFTVGCRSHNPVRTARIINCPSNLSRPSSQTNWIHPMTGDSMSTVGQRERATQNRVVKLFRDTLKYDYLGNWEDRAGNSNIEEGLSARLSATARVQRHADRPRPVRTQEGRRRPEQEPLRRQQGGLQPAALRRQGQARGGRKHRDRLADRLEASARTTTSPSPKRSPSPASTPSAPTWCSTSTASPWACWNSSAPSSRSARASARTWTTRRRPSSSPSSPPSNSSWPATIPKGCATASSKPRRSTT